jgi:two-component system, sensor histidine kinase and response regulator
MAGETILVVDDEPILRELLREILEEAGYAVATAGDGREALAVLDRVGPQLVVSDITMPGMDGYHLYAEVRARPRFVNVPFLFLSGLGSEVDVRQGKQMGADDYLTKPVHEADLLIAVRSRLDRRAQIEAAHRGQIEQLKRDILETLNHEFRTPLTVLVGYGQMLRDFGTQLPPEKMTAFVEGILRGSSRLERLVQDLVLLVDLQSGAAQRAFEEQQSAIPDLAVLLQDVVAERRVPAAARQVRLVTDLGPGLPAVRGQREMLSQAVGRLVDNAIKFAKPEGGTVTVSARAVDGAARIDVKDEGIGIPADQLERISEMFYQVDRHRMEQQGCGTGLTIARALVSLHAGTLAVTSVPGAGSTFTMTLPPSAA